MEEREITIPKRKFSDEQVEDLFRFPLTTNYNNKDHFIATNQVGTSIFRYLGKALDGPDMSRILCIINGQTQLRLKLKNVNFSYNSLFNKIIANGTDIFITVGPVEVEQMMMKGLFTPSEIHQLRTCLYDLIIRRMNNSMRKE
jgi:hypothetical protein